MNLEAQDIINIITIVPLFLYSGFLFLSKKNKSNSNLYLAVFLFTNGFYLFNFLLIRLSSQIPYDLTFIFYVGSSFSFIFGPALWIYTKSIADKNFKLKRIDFIHLIPFLLSLFYYFGGIKGFRIEYYGIKYFQIIVYFIPIFQIIKEYQSNIKDYFSAIEKLNLKRLIVIYIVFVILWGIDVSDYFALLFYGERNIVLGKILIYSSLIINFIFANLLVLFSLTRYEIPNEFDTKPKFKKYEKSNLNDSVKEEYSGKLEVLLKQDKLFLNPSLTLNEISTQLNLPARDISQIINEVFNKNFYDLINYYRIEEAKKHLAISKSNKTILEILYEVGFNSKSAFNNAFKKNTGITPTEYRKNVVNQ